MMTDDLHNRCIEEQRFAVSTLLSSLKPFSLSNVNNMRNDW